MAIATVVTRGYGNGTVTGTIPLVVTRGYAIADIATTTKDVIGLIGRWAPAAALEGRWAPNAGLVGRWAPDINVEA